MKIDTLRACYWVVKSPPPPFYHNQCSLSSSFFYGYNTKIVLHKVVIKSCRRIRRSSVVILVVVVQNHNYIWEQHHMAFFGFACFNICLLDSCSSQKLFMAIDSLYYWEEGSIAVHATEQSTSTKRRRDLYWMLLLHPSAFMAQFVSNWWLCNRPRSVEIHSHVKNVHRVICHQNSSREASKNDDVDDEKINAYSRNKQPTVQVHHHQANDQTQRGK